MLLWGGRGDPVFNNGYGFNRTRTTAGLFCNLTKGLKLREMEWPIVIFLLIFCSCWPWPSFLTASLALNQWGLVSSVQLLSCVRLFANHPVDCSLPSFPVHHQLLEPTQNHVHWVSDAIQPSQPLSSPSPPASIFPTSGSFPISQFLASGGQSIGVSASASVLPMNI